MNVLYLTFYFDPDIGPGSFRNTALVQALSHQLGPDDAIHVITTRPNRHQSYKPAASAYEEQCYGSCPVSINRIQIPTHKSGQLDQVRAFWTYFRAAYRLARQQKYDLVVASSSRLFTAFLGAILVHRGFGHRGFGRRGFGRRGFGRRGFGRRGFGRRGFGRRGFGRRGFGRRTPLYLDVRDLFREVILEMHPNPLIRCLLNVVLWPVERYTFSRANHINLVSEGFRPYFRLFPQARYSYFTNGIDEVFSSIPESVSVPDTRIKTILYAGNIGQGQSLHKIIPQAARQLGEGYRFIIFGSGGARAELTSVIREENVTNVELCDPIIQAELMIHYQNADYLFVHLDDLAAFTRVLPSKLFEYGATDKPIIAGVAGYAASFVCQHLTNAIVFPPGDVADLVRQIRETPYRTSGRRDFNATFRREAICQAMVRQMLDLLPDKSQNQSNRLNETVV